MRNLPKPFVRAVALAIIRRQDGRILMERGFDEETQEVYWRIPGGGIEFMEAASDALLREFREELNLQLTGLRFVGVVENRFYLNAAPGHEIIMIYDAELLDREAYKIDVFRLFEAEHRDGEAYWIDYREALAKGEKVYPVDAIERGWFEARVGDR